jgi:hypothetical protein
MNIDQLMLPLTEGTIDLLKKGSKYCRRDRAEGMLPEINWPVPDFRKNGEFNNEMQNSAG